MTNYMININFLEFMRYNFILVALNQIDREKDNNAFFDESLANAMNPIQTGGI